MIRIVAFLLIPCLTVDPAWAFIGRLPMHSSSRPVNASIFAIEALSEPSRQTPIPNSFTAPGSADQAHRTAALRSETPPLAATSHAVALDQFRWYIVKINPAFQLTLAQTWPADYPTLCDFSIDLASVILHEKYGSSLPMRLMQEDRRDKGFLHDWLEVELEGRRYFLSFTEGQAHFMGDLRRLRREKKYAEIFEQFHEKGLDRVVLLDMGDDPQAFYAQRGLLNPKERELGKNKRYAGALTAFYDLLDRRFHPSEGPLSPRARKGLVDLLVAPDMGARIVRFQDLLDETHLIEDIRLFQSFFWLEKWQVIPDLLHHLFTSVDRDELPLAQRLLDLTLSLDRTGSSQLVLGDLLCRLSHEKVNDIRERFEYEKAPPQLLFIVEEAFHETRLNEIRSDLTLTPRERHEQAAETYGELYLLYAADPNRQIQELAEIPFRMAQLERSAAQGTMSPEESQTLLQMRESLGHWLGQLKDNPIEYVRMSRYALDFDQAYASYLSDVGSEDPAPYLQRTQTLKSEQNQIRVAMLKRMGPAVVAQAPPLDLSRIVMMHKPEPPVVFRETNTFDAAAAALERVLLHQSLDSIPAQRKDLNSYFDQMDESWMRAGYQRFLPHHALKLQKTPPTALLEFQAFLLDYLSFLAVHTIDDGPERARENRRTLRRLLDLLQSPGTPYGGRWVEHEAQLFQFQGSFISANEMEQLARERAYIQLFADDPGPNPYSLRVVQAIGPHLRGLIYRGVAGEPTDSEEYAKIVAFHRLNNGLDYSVLLLHLSILMRDYQRLGNKDDLALTIAGGFSVDPAAMTDRSIMERIDPAIPTPYLYSFGRPILLRKGPFYPKDLPMHEREAYFSLLARARGPLLRDLRDYETSDADAVTTFFGQNTVYSSVRLVQMWLLRLYDPDIGTDWVYEDLLRLPVDARHKGLIAAFDNAGKKFQESLPGQGARRYMFRTDPELGRRAFHETLDALERVQPAPAAAHPAGRVRPFDEKTHRDFHRRLTQISWVHIIGAIALWLVEIYFFGRPSSLGEVAGLVMAPVVLLFTGFLFRSLATTANLDLIYLTGAPLHLEAQTSSTGTGWFWQSDGKPLFFHKIFSKPDDFYALERMIHSLNLFEVEALERVYFEETRHARGQGEFQAKLGAIWDAWRAPKVETLQQRKQRLIYWIAGDRFPSARARIYRFPAYHSGALRPSMPEDLRPAREPARLPDRHAGQGRAPASTPHTSRPYIIHRSS